MKTSVAFGVRLTAAGALVFLCGFFVFVFDPSTSSREVTGTVMGLQRVESRISAGRTYFLVKLDTGQEVIARAEGHIFRGNSRAVLTEEKTMLFRRTKYMFLGYSDSLRGSQG